jgi:[acyl-carrier-protein] S-malonyltransferase
VCGIANLKSPDQTVISGAVPAVLEAMRRLEAGGAKLVKQLNVSGAFHSALMRGPGEALGEALRAAKFQDATVPVIPNVTAVPEQAGAVLRDLLQRQISSPVRWEESMRSLRQLAQGPVLEVGNGNVLKGLLRRIEREAEGVSVADAAGLEAFLSKTPTG